MMYIDRNTHCIRPKPDNNTEIFIKGNDYDFADNYVTAEHRYTPSQPQAPYTVFRIFDTSTNVTYYVSYSTRRLDDAYAEIPQHKNLNDIYTAIGADNFKISALCYCNTKQEAIRQLKIYLAYYITQNISINQSNDYYQHGIKCKGTKPIIINLLSGKYAKYLQDNKKFTDNTQFDKEVYCVDTEQSFSNAQVASQYFLIDKCDIQYSIHNNKSINGLHFKEVPTHIIFRICSIDTQQTLYVGTIKIDSYNKNSYGFFDYIVNNNKAFKALYPIYKGKLAAYKLRICYSHEEMLYYKSAYSKYYQNKYGNQFLTLVSENNLKCLSTKKKTHTNAPRRVKCIETNEVFYSTATAAKKFNTDSSNIRKCCLHQRKTCANHTFEYVD